MARRLVLSCGIEFWPGPFWGNISSKDWGLSPDRFRARLMLVTALLGHKSTFVTWLKSNPPTLGPRTQFAGVRAFHHTRCAETYGSLKQFEHRDGAPFAGVAR